MILWLSLLVGLVSVRMEESPTENMEHMNITTEIFRLETTTDMSETAYSNETKEETTSITDDTYNYNDNSNDEDMIENFKEEESEEEEYRDICLYKGKRPGFTCDSGECIDRGRVCDKTGDCSDGSDETISCCSTTCITPTQGTVCLPSDGYNNTGVDCRSCSKGGYPGYRCDDGSCIYKRKVCDGRSQCRDDSDEKYCAFHLCQTKLGALVNIPRDLLDKSGDCRKCDYNSVGDGWRCNNAKCILGAWRCDGAEDCTDGSDETDQLCRPSVTPVDNRQQSGIVGDNTESAAVRDNTEQSKVIEVDSREPKQNPGDNDETGSSSGGVVGLCSLWIIGLVMAVQLLVPALLAGVAPSTMNVGGLIAMWGVGGSLLISGVTLHSYPMSAVILQGDGRGI